LAQAREGPVGDHPMKAVASPKLEAKRYAILTEEQARTFITAANAHPLETLFFLALTSSIRQEKTWV
jgi:hypothetical protein